MSLTEEQLAQIEADRVLLKYKTYDDYLDSLVTTEDHCYLQSSTISRTLAELGYRSSSETLSKEQFERRLEAVLLYLNPPYKPYELSSENMRGTDPLHVALAIRERPNRLGILSTIIFLRCLTKSGFEISGYLDYADRLSAEDWTAFFKGSKEIHPKYTDLGFYHWRTGKVVYNSSKNYKVINDSQKGLLFLHKRDGQVFSVDPQLMQSHCRRERIFSKIYEHAVLYDHLVRQCSV